VSKNALPPAIAEALGSLVPALAARGLLPVRVAVAASFGNFEVHFASKSLSLSVVRDRGQFRVSGAERAVLEPAGLWRSFSGTKSLEEPLIAWVESHDAV
jgi:hypothetical protein